MSKLIEKRDLPRVAITFVSGRNPKLIKIEEILQLHIIEELPKYIVLLLNSMKIQFTISIT